jgi:hypothetical protein
MSNNPFNRNTTKEAKLGALIETLGEQNQRDAVHIAVVPIKAHATLRPGDHIAVTEDGTTSKYGPPIGIVDPFLSSSVPTGSTFWLFLYQGSVNTLRHEWTHPAFPTINSQDNSKFQKEMSEIWLKAYAMKFTNGYDDTSEKEAYQRLLDNIEVYQGTDMHSRSELRSEKELQYHAEIVLGRKINFDDFGFSCSC